MQLIGITGAINHGKTSLAESLAKIEPNSIQLESGQLLMELANQWQPELTSVPEPSDLPEINRWVSKLPPHIENVLNVICRPEQLAISTQNVAQEPNKSAKLFSYLSTLGQQPELAKQPITVANKPAYRPLLQWLGGFLVERLDEEILFNELVRRAHSAPGVELCTIGGLRYPSDASVTRKAGGTIVNIVRPEVSEADCSDPTEVLRHNIVADITVVNNGSLEDLMPVAKQMYADIQAKHYKNLYSAI